MQNKVLLLKLSYNYLGEEINIFPTVIEDDKNLILVDCGYPNSLAQIEKEMIKNNIDIKKLTHVILTHQDDDHMGSAREIKNKYPNVKIVASSKEKTYIDGTEKNLRLVQAEKILEILPNDKKEIGINFCKRFENLEKIHVDLEVKDGEIFDWGGGCEIIETSGHTPGHISLYLKNENIVIVGDATVIENNQLVIANPEYCLDFLKAQNSLEKLKKMDVKKYYCYHGGIYMKY